MLVRLNTNFPEPVDPRIEILVTCFPTYVISAWPYPQAFHANEVGGEPCISLVHPVLCPSQHEEYLSCLSKAFV